MKHGLNTGFQFLAGFDGIRRASKTPNLQALRFTEAPNFKLQTKDRAVWWPSKAAR
jgi:hypothetical protein